MTLDTEHAQWTDAFPVLICPTLRVRPGKGNSESAGQCLHIVNVVLIRLMTEMAFDLDLYTEGLHVSSTNAPTPEKRDAW